MFKDEPSVVSTMQIASETRVVIFDCLALVGSTLFQDFVAQLIADPNIE